MTETTNTPMPLAGLKVLELGTLIAGPYASALLAQFGAEVIKIETPGEGDPLRTWRKTHNGTSLWWYSQSRNKKSVTLNLRSPAGADVIRRMVCDCDIVIENFRPGTLEKWGIGWETLSAINPRLIMVRVSGYGQSGPYREKPGFAAIAECMGGLRHVSGFPDRPPVRVGVSLGDTLAGLYGTMGALMALHHLKTPGGKGQLIDVALYEAVFAVMESLVPEYQMFGHIRERSGSALPGITPSNSYLSGDGQYVAIAANGDAIFKRLMNAMGRDDLAQNPELSDNAGRTRQSAMLDAAISDWTGRHALTDILSMLDAAAVPAGRVYTAADIVADPHYAARDMIEHHQLADGQGIDLPGIVPKLSETPGRTAWLGPSLGEHTAQVLASIGIDGAELKKLRSAGVV